jgi:hypothetical protein
MRTPAGTECKFYYEDYYRGSERRECRLLNRNPHSARWQPEHCRRCPVPGILRANACPDMILEGSVKRRFLLGEKVVVEAYCMRTMRPVPEPHVGCGECHKPPSHVDSTSDF